MERLGRFLGSLVARGAVRGAIIAGHSYAPKTYTPDVLTVEQLAGCLKQARKLDGDDAQLEATRSELLASASEIDRSSAAIELQRTRINHYSQQSVDAFNALITRYNSLVTSGKARQAKFNSNVNAFNSRVNAYNLICVKKYYAEDLPDAQKLAAQP